MKTRTLLKTFSKAALTLALLTSLEAKAQGTVTFSKPGNAMYYEHDRTNWNHIYNVANTYNANGDLTAAIKTVPVTNQNASKEEYTYDASNRILTYTFSNWQNNAWAISRQDNNILTLNAAGKVTEQILQTLKNGALANSLKINMSYDPAGNRTQYVTANWINNAWVNNSKNDLTYSNGVQTEHLFSLYDKVNSVWTPQIKTTFAGWHAGIKQPTVALAQKPDGNGTWQNSRRTTYTVGQHGSYEVTEENFQNGTWIYADRTNYTYDAQHNLTDYLFEEFVNGAWRMVWKDKNIYSYSAQNDLLEMINQGQDSTYGPIRNLYKEVYSNFQYFTRVLGTSELQAANIGLTLFPNPTKDILNIELTKNAAKLQKDTVSDLTGKAVLTRTFSPEDQKQLNLEKLPAGIYLLKLETEKGQVVQKFVKQ